MNLLLAASLGLLLAGCQALSIKSENLLEHEPVVPPIGRHPGLQSGILYQYKYTGTVSTWVSEDPMQFSGSALRADLELERARDGSLRIKASNVEVAETNGEASCHPEKNIDFSYHPMDPTDASLLEQPFLIQTDGETVTYIKVPDELLWVTNVRRGIINSLPLSTLLGHSPSTLTFRLQEETLIGECYNWYSQIKLSGYLADVENKKQEDKIEEDVQRYIVAEDYTAGTKTKTHGSKTKQKGGTKTTGGTKTGGDTKTKGPGPPSRYVRPINDTLWILTRTLDNEGCEENHFTVKLNGNHESAERTQRSSQATFLIRGKLEDVVRLERAEVDGNILVYTGDCKDKFIRTMTKQVLDLKAVRHAEVHVEIAAELERKKLSFEAQEGPSLFTVEEQLTGIYPTELQVQAIITKIVEDLELLTPHYPEQSEAAKGVFLRVVERIAVLTKSEIELLVSQVPNTPKVKKILYQALLTSGTNEALTYLLEKMRDPNFRNDNLLLVYQFFQATTITIKDPSLIPDLLDVVSRMEEDDGATINPIKTASLLNIAKLAHQYCLNPRTAESCDPRCSSSDILNSLLPVLSQGLRDSVKWRQLIYLQAMCTLGTPQIIPILEPIIKGKNKDDIDLRLSAIYCLTADHQPKTAHSAVMDILVPVMNNPSEFPEVRSIAFLAITTWEPTNLSWWEFVAHSTWRENSTQVAAFISTTLISLSDGLDPRSESAKKVVKLAKHPNKRAAYSLSNSVYFYLEETLENCRENTNIRLAWLSTTRSVFPRTVLHYLQASTVLGMSTRETAVYFGNALQKVFKKTFPKTFVGKTSDLTETIFGMFEELQEQLELTSTGSSERQLLSFLSFFEPLHLITAMYGEDDRFSSINSLFNDASILLGLYVPLHFRLADSTLAFPSDLGLPVIVKHETDLETTIGHRFFNRDFEIFLRVDNELSVKVKTLVPWTEGRAAGASLESHVQIFLPIHIDEVSYHQRKVKLLLPSHPVDLLTLSNSMYTTLTPLFPFTGAALVPGTSLGRKVVLRREERESTRTIQVLQNLGIHFTSEWRGDFQKPKDLITVFTELDPTHIHYSNFKYRLVYDPRSSTSKNITFNAHVYIKKCEDVSQTPGQQTTQFTQGTGDYEFFTQVSGSPDSEYFTQSTGGGLDIMDGQTQSQTVTTHLQRIEDQLISSCGMYTVSLSIEPDSGPRQYEFVFTVAFDQNNKIGTTSSTNYYVTFVDGSVTDIFGGKHWTCFDMKLQTPYLTPLIPENVLLETESNQSLMLSMNKQDSCLGQSTLELTAHWSMSSAATGYIQDERDREACDGSYPIRLLPLYDTMHLEITGDPDLLYCVADSQHHLSDSLGLNMVKFSLDSRQQYQQSTDKIIVDAELDLKTSEWEYNVRVPQATVVYSMPRGSLLEVVGINFVQNRVFDAVNSNLDKTCYLTQHSVRTFDGLVHEFEPSPCWTAATVHIPAEDSPEFKNLQISIQARYIDDFWEVRLMWPYPGLILDITRLDLRVNEEEFSGRSDKFVVHRLGDSQLVEVGMVLIRVGDTVEIRIADLYYGEVAGLCGNYDGEPNNDMKGPLGCLYTDPILQATAWSSPASGCSRIALRSKKSKLGDVRDSCEKEVFQPTGITQHNVMENCTTWQYHDRTSSDGLQCHSRVPVPVCQPGCQPSLTFNSNLKYDCTPPSSSTGQQQVYDSSSSQCFSKVLPAAIPSGCYHQ